MSSDSFLKSLRQIKPGTYVSENQLEFLKELDKEREIVVKRIDGIIIPKNKPLIVHKKRLNTAKKSKYYSDMIYQLYLFALYLMLMQYGIQIHGKILANRYN